MKKGSQNGLLRWATIALLALLCVCLCMIPNSVFATSSLDDADDSVPNEAVLEEGVIDDPPVSDVTEEEPAAEPAEEETVPSEPAAADGGAAVVEEEEGSEVVLNDDTLTFSGKANRVNVEVKAEPGTFPVGTTMKVETVKKSEVIDAIESVIEDEIVTVRAVDITFVDADGKEVQPAKEVKVSLTSTVFDEDANVSVVHVEDPEKNKAEVMELEESKKDTTAEFKTDGFSIYAIVETGQDARVLVRFVKPDGTPDGEELASVYVKSDDNMQQVLYDPGVGTLPDGVTFKGWTTVQDYTAATPALTIAEVRTAVTGMLPPATDGTVVTYYAMLFKSYTIVYYDENNISLGQDEVVFRADSTETAQSYTVNMAYTVSDNEHNFEGWLVNRGGSNIDGYTEGTAYENGTEITITGDIQFGVNAPAGHWLVFNENGKGAKYNAPKFLKTDEVTSKPCPDSEMTRFGYTFGGWYADAACTQEFTFGYELTDYTTIYAKWNSDTKADYTVIIWKQNVSGEGYDFYKSVHIEDADVGTTPNAVTTSGTGNNAYATVDGTAYSSDSSNAEIKADFTGFHFEETDQADKTVATEGNTVVNVYYDRNEITFNFYTYNNQTTYEYTLISGSPSTSYNHPTYYALINGQYRELTYYSNASGWPNYDPAGWYYGGSWASRGTRYTGNDFYTRESVSAGWHIDQTMTGLYGSTLADNNYTWPTNYDWYSSGGNNGSTSGTRTTFLDAFLPTSTDTTINFYGSSNQGSNHIYFYTQNADKNGYTLANTVNTNATGFNLSDKYNGFTCVAWNTSNNTSNWNVVGELMKQDDGNYYYDAYPNQSGYQTASIGNNGLHVYFNRKDFKLTFLNGSYYNTAGNTPTLAETASPTEFKEEDSINYGADLSSYNKGGDDYYEPTVPSGDEGYVFDGWYLDDKCTQLCTFTTMPEGGLTVYAKWMKIQYRAFLHPNYPEGASGDIDWGNSNQAMNFRIDYGGKISAPYGRLNGYEFVGWYSDEACTQAFNANAYVLNETTVTDTYNKDTDFTDPYDVNGNLGANPSNSDKTGYGGKERFWITKKIDIYAKWRSTLDGASGIGLVYDVNGGSNPPTDTKTYVDGAAATAGAASTPASADKKFAYWVMQKWNGTDFVDVSGSKIFPGESFEVLAANAKVEDILNPEAGADTKKYTVQLRAEYVDTEKPTPTHIYWYKNDGSEAFRKDEDLEINAGVTIPGAPDRAGYTFKGWARVDIGNTLEVANAWEGNSDNWTQDLDEGDLYLYYAPNRADGGTYHLGSTSGTAVTQVAADEDTPYHAMFAVWEEDEVTINYAVADDSIGMGSVSPTSETVKAVSGEPQGSTASATSNTYIFDYWTVDNGTESINTDAEFVPSQEDGVYKEHTYYAHFKLNKATVTVHHYLKGTETPVADDESSQETIGSEYTATPATTYQEMDLTVDSYNPSQTVTVSENGNEITIYYTLPLTITAKTDSKPYDGTPLNGEYTVTGALDSDAAAIETALGTAPYITNVSESPKDYLTEGEQQSITGIPSYYAVTYTPGTLTINKKAISFTGESATKTYTGSEIELTGVTSDAEAGVVNGHSSNVEYSAKGKEVGEYPGTITAANAVVIVDADDNNVTSNYEITTTAGKLTIEATDETFTISLADDTYTYDGQTHYNTKTASSTAASGETTYSYSFEENGTYVNDLSSLTQVNAGDYTIYVKGSNPNYANEATTTAKLTINKKAVTITAKDASKPYDGTPLTQPEFTATALEEGDTHTFTVIMTEASTITNEGTQPNVIATVDGIAVTTGTETAVGNYLVTTVDGNLEITKNTSTITVVPGSGSKTYDGTALTKTAHDDFTVSGVPEGFTWEATADGTVTNVTPGEGEKAVNAVTSFKILNGDGVDVTDQFANIDTSATGTLAIVPKAVTITTEPDSKEYDGTPLTKKEASITGLVNNETATVTATGSQTEVGKSDNTYNIDWGTTNKDNYKISEKLGTLEVTTNNSNITVTGGSSSKTYDGTPLTDTTVTATGLPEGFTVEATTSGSQTDAGSSENTVTSYVIKNAAGEDKTEYFTNVSLAPGTLTVEPANLTVTITGNHAKKTYNGKEQSVTGYTISIPDGATLTEDEIIGPAQEDAIAKGTKANGGSNDDKSYPMGLSADQFSTKNTNYNVTFEVTDGWLKITPKKSGGGNPVPALNTEDHIAYVIGYEDETVRPENNITRAEVAMIFFRLLTDETRDAALTDVNSYSDVEVGDWYNTAVSTMSALGIIKGYPDGTFKPNNFITRAEFAAIAARFDDHESTGAVTFNDIEGHWAEEEVCRAAELGWVNGYPDGSFRPNQDITRAEAMALINRVLVRNPETVEDLLEDMPVWKDNMDTTKWYYIDVQEASIGHEYARKPNNTEYWTALKPDYWKAENSKN